LLIRRREGDLLLFRQVDHGTLAGEFVGHWGSKQFASPTPFDHVLLATTIHDEGWRVADAEPLFNETDERPLGFAEIDQRDHIPLYRRGVDEVFRQDAYAYLLVSMHWTGLYRGRWGLQPMPITWNTTGRTPVQVLQDEAITAEEHRWIDVKHQLVNGGFRTDFETNLWHNFDLLQAYDLLSIFVCVTVHEPAPEGDEPQLLGQTLRTLEQEPGARIIPNVPTAVGGERVDLVLRAVDTGVVTVDPYPFREDEIELSIEATSIPDRRYANQAEARAAIENCDKVTVSCRMVRG
jgi:hypothetical protein